MITIVAQNCTTLHPPLDQLIPDMTPKIPVQQIAYKPIDMLPPMNHWTNCKDLPEVCDVPELEALSLNDLVVFRFENGTMIVKNISASPIEK